MDDCKKKNSSTMVNDKIQSKSYQASELVSIKACVTNPTAAGRFLVAGG
jgi:hypothetical protein